MKDIYFNTTKETNPQLEVFKKKATGQDNIVAALFSENPLQRATPSEVWRVLLKRGSIGAKTPLTSVRRSMNTLTKGDNPALVKLSEQKPKGFYGRKEHYWIKCI